MNPSHSTTLSIANPLRAPSDTPGGRSGRSSGERAGDSFNALYHSETASFDDDNHTNDSNINKLKEDRERKSSSSPEEKSASNDADSPLRNGNNEDALAVDEPSQQDNKDEISAQREQDLAQQDQLFETELLHGISVALPSNSPQSKVGEKFPASGKELPLAGELSEQDALLTRPATESELRDVAARAGAAIQGRGDSSGIDDRSRRDKVVELTSTRLDSSMNENKLETAQSKIFSEPLTESLTLLASKASQEPPIALPTSNNSPANLAAVASQIDSAAAQKLSLQADAVAGTDLSAGARNNSYDWSSALGEKVHWMRSANISVAELHLHPAELGSIEIKIVTEDQQARVSFITSSASARDVIEESLPKLRDLLADGGLELDQSDISQKESGDESARKDDQVLPENNHIERELKREFTTSPISQRIGQVDQYV